MSDWRSFEEPPIPSWTQWYMWGMFVWGIGMGAIAMNLYLSIYEHQAPDRLPTYWTMVPWAIGFALCMRGKYVAWREAQQQPPPDAP